MTTLKLPSNYLFTGIIAIALLLTISSCARKAVFQTSTVVPAARGSVKVKKDNNNNHLISVNIRDLAEPDRLQPPMTTYVVWMVTDENSTKNLGQIQTGTKFLSKSLKGSFKTVSSFKPVRIFITAENEAAIQFPGMYTVLSTNDF
jgi:hypothetical protein